MKQVEISKKHFAQDDRDFPIFTRSVESFETYAIRLYGATPTHP
jgi:hypothetical protein